MVVVGILLKRRRHQHQDSVLLLQPLVLVYEARELRTAPVDEEHSHKLTSSAVMRSHPLAEISRSPGHFLLLKLWQWEEDLFGRRMLRKESRMDTIRGEIFHLCSHFLLFHDIFFTILFTSSSPEQQQHRCRKWWIPAVLSGLTSLVVAIVVQMKLWRYWKAEGQLQRERAEARALTRYVQELRMKGESFDLSKEPNRGKKLKSSSVEIKWAPLTWCSRYKVTLFLVSFAGLALPSCRFLLCS